MMPDEPDQAIRFGKARSAQSGALLEDYVELISDLLAMNGEARPTDIARRLGVSHATVIKTIGRLKREGLAVAKPYRGVFLTEPGETLADRVRARLISASYARTCALLQELETAQAELNRKQATESATLG